jgi:hypothetical protein
MSNTTRLVLGGVALVTVGMILVFAGIMVAGLFLPGALLIAAGMLVLAGGGVLAVWPVKEKAGSTRAGGASRDAADRAPSAEQHSGRAKRGRRG